MNRPIFVSGLLASMMLGACATSPAPSSAMVEARSTVASAERDPAVLAHAPLELQKATQSLARAATLQAAGEPMSDVDSAAIVAGQQARAAIAIGQAKSSEDAVSAGVLERERMRGDAREQEARRAQAQAGWAQSQASTAQSQARSAMGQASVAESRADAARQQSAAAEQRAMGAEQRASGAEQRAAGAERDAAVSMSDASDAQRRNAVLQQRLNDMQAKQTERGMLVTLGDVLFEFNQAQVRPTAQMSLRKLAEFLQAYPARRVLIEGHTDNVGSSSYNDALSLRRADSVDAALVAMGLTASRFTTVGYGKDFPVAENTSDTNRALNRRVEVYIADDDQPVKARR